MDGLHGWLERDGDVAAAGGVPQSKRRVDRFGQFVPDCRHDARGKSLVRSADYLKHELSRESVRGFQQLDGRHFAHDGILDSKGVQLLPEIRSSRKFMGVFISITEGSGTVKAEANIFYMTACNGAGERGERPGDNGNYVFAIGSVPGRSHAPLAGRLRIKPHEKNHFLVDTFSTGC